MFFKFRSPRLHQVLTSALLATSLLGTFAPRAGAFAIKKRPCPKNPNPAAISFSQGEAVVRSPGKNPQSFTFAVELADEQEQQNLGFMYRPEIPKETGMLFRYTSPKAMAIWMKNTCAPLDLIFVGAGDQIVAVARNLEPFSLTPHPSPGEITSVLEVAAGEVDRLGIQPGWTLQLISTKTSKSSPSKTNKP